MNIAVAAPNAHPRARSADFWAQFVFPLQMRKLRKAYASGWSRNLNAISLLQRRRARLTMHCIRTMIQHAGGVVNPHFRLTVLRAVQEMFCDYTSDFALRFTRPPVRDSIRRLIRLVDNATCADLYRIRSWQELLRLYNLSNFPDRIDIGQGQFKFGEEAFLFFHRRMASLERLSDLAREFGGEPTGWGKCFRATATLLYPLARRKLRRNLPFFAQRFPAYARGVEAVCNKYALDNLLPLVFALGMCAVALFIDCNCKSTCRPGAGPAADGPGAPRADPAGNLENKFRNCGSTLTRFPASRSRAAGLLQRMEESNGHKVSNRVLRRRPHR